MGLRYPIISLYTQRKKNMYSKINNHARPYELELLKYHNICSGKYDALDMVFATKDAPIMTDEQITDIVKSYTNVLYKPTGI